MKRRTDEMKAQPDWPVWETRDGICRRGGDRRGSRLGLTLPQIVATTTTWSRNRQHESPSAEKCEDAVVPSIIPICFPLPVTIQAVVGFRGWSRCKLKAGEEEEEEIV